MMQLRHPNVLLTMGIAYDEMANTCGIVMEAMEASLMDVIVGGDEVPARTTDPTHP